MGFVVMLPISGPNNLMLVQSLQRDLKNLKLIFQSMLSPFFSIRASRKCRYHTINVYLEIILFFIQVPKKMQKSFHDYIVGKHFSNLGTQKSADSSNKSTISHHFFSFGNTNKYAKFLLGDAKTNQNNNNNDLICSQFLLVFQVHKRDTISRKKILQPQI